MFFVQINHTGKGFLFLIFREIKLRKYSSLHKLFYGLIIRMNKKIKVTSVAAVALASLVLSNVNLSNEISFKEVIDF